MRDNGDAAFELFDLADDPGETRDVSAAHPAVIARMQAIVAEAHVQSLEAPLFASEQEGANIPPYVSGVRR